VFGEYMHGLANIKYWPISSNIPGFCLNSEAGEAE
jgi:hypothetical protein